MLIICPIICMTIFQFISIFYTFSTLIVLKEDSKANIKIFYSAKSSRDLKERRWKCIRRIFQNQSDFHSILITTCIVNFYFWVFLKLWAFKRGHILSCPLSDGFNFKKSYGAIVKGVLDLVWANYVLSMSIVFTVPSKVIHTF